MSNRQKWEIRVYIISVALIVASALYNHVAHAETRAGLIYGSVHLTGTRDWNERHQGFYVEHNDFVIGSYINSYSGTRGYEEDRLRSYFLAYDHTWRRYRHAEVSWTAGGVTGYPHNPVIPWFSLNFRIGGKDAGVKTWFIPGAAIAYGLEFGQ